MCCAALNAYLELPSGLLPEASRASQMQANSWFALRAERIVVDGERGTLRQMGQRQHALGEHPVGAGGNVDSHMSASPKGIFENTFLLRFWADPE